MSSSDERRWRRGIVASALATTTALVLYALASGSAHRHYDVDEIQHAHVTWRIAGGERPFHDFVESHPPFVWYLAAPIVERIQSPVTAMRVLRTLSAIAGALFIGLVIACGRTGQPGVSVPWSIAGALLALSTTMNLDYFLEARPDSVAHVLLFAGLLLFLLDRPRALFWRYALFAFLASTAILWTPKLALLVVLFALADLWIHRRESAHLLLRCAGHAVGIGAALVAAIAVLRFEDVDPRLAYELSIGFHARFLAETSFSHGLLRRVLEEPLLLAVALAGVISWGTLVVSRRIRPAPLEIAVLGSSASALVLVHLPYKQYFAPWFLLTLVVFVPFVGAGLRALSERWSRRALLALLGVAAWGAWTAAEAYNEHDQAGFFHVMWDRMEELTPADGRVIAAPQWHPIYRKDVFYGWFSTFDPGGRNQDVLLAEWNPMGYGSRFTLEGYRRELQENRPALIVTVGEGFGLPRAQEQAIRDYLDRSDAVYVRLPLAGKIGLLVRRDADNGRDIDRWNLRPRR